MKDNKQEWEKEFFTRFRANTIWVTPSKDNVETILDIHSFISEKLKEQRERIIDEIIETTKIIKAITQQSDDWYDGLTYEKDVIINKLKQ